MITNDDVCGFNLVFHWSLIILAMKKKPFFFSITLKPFKDLYVQDILKICEYYLEIYTNLKIRITYIIWQVLRAIQVISNTLLKYDEFLERSAN